MIALIVGAISDVQWLAWSGLVVVGLVGLSIFVLEIGPKILSLVGYWFPGAGLKAAKLDAWLERDLDWGR
ncbi:MAG: hypothetical protein MRY81_22100 [Donghicola eburneus]|nr:hypothetical protein [Donghicola eburneus]MCI5042352.1 hypothetical protein [Donghicola eburneus]